MGPEEKRLTGELAVYLVRSYARAFRDLPPDAAPDLAVHRRWFDRAYREWQLTPRVDLLGRSPYEAIAAERTARATSADIEGEGEPAIELYTDLPIGEFTDRPDRPPHAQR